MLWAGPRAKSYMQGSDVGQAASSHLPSKRSRIISRQLSSALLTLPLSLPPFSRWLLFLYKRDFVLDNCFEPKPI
jgi:hypothetical protein